MVFFNEVFTNSTSNNKPKSSIDTIETKKNAILLSDFIGVHWSKILKHPDTDIKLALDYYFNMVHKLNLEKSIEIIKKIIPLQIEEDD